MDFFLLNLPTKSTLRTGIEIEPPGNQVIPLLILMVAIRFGNDYGMQTVPRRCFTSCEGYAIIV
jgi:hypothetical protein